MSYLGEHSKKAKNLLARTTHSVAKEYLFKHGYVSSSFTLPEFYKASGFEEMHLAPLWQEPDKLPKITMPIDLYSPKGNLGWRRFNLLHPYIYWHLVNDFTEIESWKLILDKLTKETKVACYSLPEIPSKEKVQGHGVKSWLKFAETDLLRDAGAYSHLLITDISSFYPSVYTHSIAWAINGKEEIRQHRRNYGYRGNRLDKLFQNSRDGKTNGIPVGTSVSDIVAECILADVDSELTELLEKAKYDYIGARYRDDYRFLCRSYSQAQDILRKLNRILHNKYDLSLNSDKTEIYEDIVASSIRPWSKQIRQNALFIQLDWPTSGIPLKGRELRHILLAIYDIQKNNPAGRPSISVLTRLIKYLRKQPLEEISLEDVHFAIVVLRRLSKLREETTPHVIITIDILMDQFSNLDKLKILKDLYAAFLGEQDNTYQEIWLHRLTQHHAPFKLTDYFGKSTNPIIRMAMGSYSFDYKMFEEADLNASDLEEMKKFKLVDRPQQEKLVEKPIDEEEISIFGYFDGERADNEPLNQHD